MTITREELHGAGQPRHSVIAQFVYFFFPLLALAVVLFLARSATNRPLPTPDDQPSASQPSPVPEFGKVVGTKEFGSIDDR